MTNALFQEGMAYAEDNFLNPNAPHLHLDKKLVKNMFDLTGKRVLDFGCGMGGMSLWYATNWDCRVYGLDIDEHHITIANALKEKHQVDNIVFDQRNVLDDPLRPEERFDVVFLNDVAEHIPYPVLHSIFRSLENGLHPGGQVFVTYPSWHGPYASHVTHVVKIPWCQFLPQRYLKSLIKKHNLPIVGKLESDLLQAYDGLNHLTHQRLMATLEGTGFYPTYRRSQNVLNKLPGLKNRNINFFPFHFLVTKEFLLLEKREADAKAVQMVERVRQSA